MSFDKILSITLIALVLYYLFKDAGSTVSIMNGLSDLYSNSVKTLQGR